MPEGLIWLEETISRSWNLLFELLARRGGLVASCKKVGSTEES